MKIKNICLCALFVALMTLGAYIKIPLAPMPLTFQLQICLFGAILLGAGKSTAAVGVYLFAGFSGLPLFSKGGGVAYFLEPTAGYLLAFLPGALLTALVFKKLRKQDTKAICLSMLAGMCAVETIGIVYCYAITALCLQTEVDLTAFLLTGLLLATVKDVLLCIPFSFAAKRILPVINTK